MKVELKYPKSTSPSSAEIVLADCNEISHLKAALYNALNASPISLIHKQFLTNLLAKLNGQ